MCCAEPSATGQRHNEHLEARQLAPARLRISSKAFKAVCAEGGGAESLEQSVQAALAVEVATPRRRITAKYQSLGTSRCNTLTKSNPGNHEQQSERICS